MYVAVVIKMIYLSIKLTNNEHAEYEKMGPSTEEVNCFVIQETQRRKGEVRRKSPTGLFWGFFVVSYLMSYKIDNYCT